jgi:olefin beta-lactone synthetase
MSRKEIDGNVASRLDIVADLMPGAIAIAQPAGPVGTDGMRNYDLTTFGSLRDRATRIARGLTDYGIRDGMRIVMLVPFGSEFITLAFAVLKTGASVVLIDPGMDRNHLIQCLADTRPDGFIGIPKAQAIRTLLRRKFPTAKHNVTVGRRWFWGGRTLQQIENIGSISQVELPERQDQDPAAIIFTTGSTGPPKGVLYTHGTFHAQIDRIRERYDIHRGSRDLACFPLFGLFDAVMGVTTIIPDMDPTRPAEVNPMRLVEAARQWEADQAFGSPALWKTVVKWAETHAPDDGSGSWFPTLRRVLSAGAPVPAETLAPLRKHLHPEANVFTPYGATEALPIASIESRQIISQTGPAAAKGKGVCVGQRFEGVLWKVIEITDDPIVSIQDVVPLPTGKIGELIVAGPMVTRQYVVREDQNAFHKIVDGDSIWHRMGDVGYLDDEDRFWFCGRKGHRVVMGDRTLFTIPCEAIFNQHPKVNRSALVPRGNRPNQEPVIIIEPVAGTITNAADRQTLVAELKEIAAGNPLTRRITDIRIREKPLPVDIRHNSKIFREKLAAEIAD